MVLGGRLADAFGARSTLLAGLGLFTAASLMCGLAGDGAVLIAGRALQSRATGRAAALPRCSFATCPRCRRASGTSSNWWTRWPF
ncbi:hypothetical protein [Nonomuraea aridisoli]|uniref:hypothetical protein n=1 Tax=Nonomuraea aridisoli TaxID=2070368 RepID=UPI001F19A441|nr:hypothetical protein [Nonomuraea aridisoli]